MNNLSTLNIIKTIPDCYDTWWWTKYIVTFQGGVYIIVIVECYMFKGVITETKFIKGDNFKWMKTIIKGSKTITELIMRISQKT